jgi:hypothetical protein
MTREEQAQYISEKLMENPEFRKTFVGAITDAINVVVKAINALEQEPSISEDGTLTVNVEDGSKASRVLVCGDNHFGGLYYPEQEPCEDAISRQAVIEVLNKMDRYVADELTLCDTERKFPKNEVFIVDDVYEEIVEQLPSVKLKQRTGE